VNAARKSDVVEKKHKLKHVPPRREVHGDAATIPLAMLVVFGSAKLLAEIFERIGQPAIVGEIIAGVLVGPSVLGWIQPNQVLSALADLGVMFLLFRVGLEVKPSGLLRVGGVAALAAALGVVAPFLLGWGIMSLWGAGHVEAIFVGAAMVATSVGITAQVLRSKGLLGDKSSQIILAAAIIDDVLGLIVLAVVSGLARDKVNLLEILLTGIMALVFTLVVALWGTKALARVVPYLQRGLAAGEVEFNLGLILLFGLSLLAVYAGVAAITGAFLAGMALSETAQERVRDLIHGVTELLVPFFLAGIGLHLDLHIFAQPAVLLLSGVILAAAILSKLLGCGLAVARLGWTAMLRVGTGMIPRVEVGMVVAQLGLSMGVIPKRVYAVVVFMAIMTTIIAPPLINLAFRGAQRQGRQEELQIG
jgi:Kef-type K+ transport system membrane component KefB